MLRAAVDFSFQGQRPRSNVPPFIRLRPLEPAEIMTTTMMMYLYVVKSLNLKLTKTDNVMELDR